ncbi:aldehyde dehydrogenase family protein, partial [Mycobacterium sp. 1165196.3]|uniref:aldehyde dehydrogenase family protein n=1 Tax=Mycobacterium sp. 1165196.3 TaxID=1834071 RepID=UPI001E51A6A7
MPRDVETPCGVASHHQACQTVDGVVRDADGFVFGAIGHHRQHRPEHLERGFYYEPTAFVDCRSDMRLCQEEVFGRVLAVMTYRSEDEAIRIANDSIY